MMARALAALGVLVLLGLAIYSVYVGAYAGAGGNGYTGRRFGSGALAMSPEIPWIMAAAMALVVLGVGAWFVTWSASTSHAEAAIDAGEAPLRVSVLVRAGQRLRRAPSASRRPSAIRPQYLVGTWAFVLRQPDRYASRLQRHPDMTSTQCQSMLASLATAIDPQDLGEHFGKSEGPMPSAKWLNARAKTIDNSLAKIVESDEDASMADALLVAIVATNRHVELPRRGAASFLRSLRVTFAGQPGDDAIFFVRACRMPEAEAIRRLQEVKQHLGLSSESTIL